VHFVGLYYMIILQYMVQKTFFFIWKEPIAHLQILTVKTKAKYKFSHDHVILYTKKLRNFAYFFKVCYRPPYFCAPFQVALLSIALYRGNM